MKKLFLVLTLVLFVSSFLGADIYVKNMERTEAFELMGKKQPEKVEIKEQWLGKNKFAQFGKEYSIIVDYDKDKIYFIIHKLKDYYVFPTSFDREKLLELLLGLNPKAAEVVESIKITDAKVNLSGEKKKIANWDCFSSEFEMVFAIPALGIMPKYKIKLWTTKDIPFNYKSYTEGLSEFFGKFILGIINVDENSIKELEKLDKMDGFQVAAEITINIFGSEIKVESQSLEIAEKPAPPGTYSVPKGYTKKTIHLPGGLDLF
ncbi:MAG: hypothetical protein WBC20_02105 [Candidatus Aminicenantaceae bacterium]